MQQLNEKPNRTNRIETLSEVLKYLPGAGAERRNKC